MAKKAKLTDAEEVEEYLKNLNHTQKDTVLKLREILLKANKELAEQIKWNSMSFYYSGNMDDFDAKTYKRDLVVLNLNKAEYVLMVFPTGATINDTTGLLEGNYPDGRKMIKIANKEDADSKEKQLKILVNEWLKTIKK